MKFLVLFLLITGHFLPTRNDCVQPTKFYVECLRTRGISDAIQFCNGHQMTLVNLTNSTGTLASDVAILNSSFVSNNCSGYFWFSSGNQTGLVINILQLGSILTGLLGSLLNPVLCTLPLACVLTTTVAPITNAMVVCTRPIQQRVVQKCSLQTERFDMKTYQFSAQPLRAGVLTTYPTETRTICNSACASNTTCVGTLYENSDCTLYM